MPTYHFTVISGLVHDVGLGVVLDDIAAARAHAEQIAKIAAKRPSYQEGTSTRIQVTDSNGTIVIEVPISVAQ